MSVFPVRLTTELASITTQGLATATGVIGVQPSSHVQWALYQQLFDCYRIRRVKITIHPTFNFAPMASAAEPAGGTAPTYTAPSLLTAISYNDVFSLPPGTILQYQTCKRTSVLKDHVRSFVPMASIAMVQPGGTSVAARMNIGDAWIDTSNSVFHNGLLWEVDSLCDVAQTLYPFTFQVFAEFDLEFKNVV
jgi:hypothetical protein